MNTAVVEKVYNLRNEWSVLPVKTEGDIVTVLNLYSNFTEYHGGMNEVKESRQLQKINSRNNHFFLLKNSSNDASGGYYSAQWPCPEYSDAVLFDQLFITPEYRGKGLSKLLIAHLMNFVANTFYSSKPPKQIIGKHFRQESTSDPQGLAAVKNIFKNFGFKDMFQKDPNACPKTQLRIDNTIFDYLELFEA